MSCRILLFLICLPALQGALAQEEAREEGAAVSGRTIPETSEIEGGPEESGSPESLSRQRLRGGRAEWLSLSKLRSPGGGEGVTPGGTTASSATGSDAEQDGEAGREVREEGPGPEEFPPLWERLLKMPSRLVAGKEEAPRADYYSVEGDGASFHLTNFEVPWETKEFDIKEGMVGRSLGEGEKWAWVELHTGAVGLMRKKHLSGASRSQIDRFLSLEAESRKPVTSGPAARDPYEGLTVPMQRGRSPLSLRRVSESGEAPEAERVEPPKAEAGATPAPQAPLETPPAD
ncbi:MAG: hypothetical protein KGS60_11920 [Verrucomicrobia bacterium]|nr:hypothetical protein [Verrucomicrobiota bacterium]